MGNQKLEVQIHSVHTNEDIETQKLKEQYLEGKYTEFQTRRKREKIQKLVGIDIGEQVVKAVVVEWKSHHIPPEQLITEYRSVCKDIAKERQHSTVSPHLQSKLHRLEELILA
jgi:activator of 2-hydroxyglutaryl-CoA dehydratase